MTKCGETIAFHRKRLNLTQTELGEKLNVTAQAVSKWENDISEPDLGTVQRLCKIFGITIDEMLNDSDEETAAAEVPAPVQEPAPAPVAAPATAPAPAPAPAPKIIVGYCDGCKRPIYQGEKYTVHTHRGGTQTVLCPSCAEERDKRRRESAYRTEKKAFARGLICGGVVGVILILVSVITTIVENDPRMLAGLLAAAMGFTFAAMMFWSETLQGIFLFFFKSFRMPGLIFTLNLDGIIWFITVKLGLMLLSGLLSVLCFLFGCVFTFLVSFFMFPFACTAECHKLKKLKREAQR